MSPGRLPDVTLKTWRAITTPVNILAIGCTIFRLYQRSRKRQLWWDDYWAGVSLIFTFAYMFAPWLRDETDDPRPPNSKRILVYWWGTLLFLVVVWTARISIGMSIARLTPPKTRHRHLLYALNGVFAAMCVGQLLHKLVVCTLNTAWHHNRMVQCYLGKPLGILALSMDLVADTCLISIPLRMLWRVKLPRRQRRLILSIFASSLASSSTGIVYTVFIFEFQKRRGNWGYRIGVVSAIKAAVTLLVCNLLVIVTYLYRTFWKEDGETVSEPSETRSKPTYSFPTPIIPGTSTLVLTEISTLWPSTAESPPRRLSESVIFVHSLSRYPATPIKRRHNRRLTL